MKNTGNSSTGDYSTGDYSTGDYSTGDYSTGDYSTGSWSTGDWSTGNYSTGNCSTGNCSTGSCSTGSWSTGYRSTGDYSTGNSSTGDWSISNYSTGHFSTIDYSGYGAFNKPCSIETWEKAWKPDFLYFALTVWVSGENMSQDEKEKNPRWETTGGYLKVFSYKEAWKRAWENATDCDKELLYALPNFDADVFMEISGIDVRKKTKCIVIDGKEIEISKENYDALKKALTEDEV